MQRPYDKVISSLPAQSLARITHGQLPALNDFQAVSVMAVNIWYPVPNLGPPGLGYLIPRSVQPDLNPEHGLGVFFDSNVEAKLPDEPAGTKLFVLMGGHHYDRPGVQVPNEEQAIAQAKALVERHLGIPASQPCHAEARFNKGCIPQHHVGHQDRLVQLHKEVEERFGSGLSVVGGSFSRIGAMAALRDGFHAAQVELVREDGGNPISSPSTNLGWYESLSASKVAEVRPLLKSLQNGRK